VSEAVIHGIRALAQAFNKAAESIRAVFPELGDMIRLVVFPRRKAPKFAHIKRIPATARLTRVGSLKADLGRFKPVPG